MGNLHLVCLAVALILTVFQLGKTSGDVVTTTGVTTSQTTTSASKTTQATGANSVPGESSSKPPGNGSIMHGLSPLVLMCGILAKLFLSA